MRVPDTDVVWPFGEVGVNVTETVQVPPLPASVPTQFWLGLNSLPLAVMPLIHNATVLEFSHRQRDGHADLNFPERYLLRPDSQRSSNSLPLDGYRLGSVAARVRHGEVALRAPSAVGVKVTSTMELPPAGTARPCSCRDPARQSRRDLSHRGEVAIVIDEEDFFGLEIVTGLAVLVAPGIPNTSLPKSSVLGVTTSADVAANTPVGITSR